MTRITTIAWVALLLVLATRVEATDRFFRDMEGRSESERYVVVAKSPDNRQEGNGAGDAHAFPAEGSPVGIHVSDSGHTVIYTGWQELLVIDAGGKEKGKIDILEDGFTKEENRKYVSRTTAGPMWAGRSHWYIIEADSKEYFVIRPWWGRHLVIDLATGGITPLTKSLATETARAEKAYVIRVLQGVSDGGEARTFPVHRAGSRDSGQ